MSVDSHVLPVLPEEDLAMAAAMVEELESYLIGDELFKTVLVRTPGQGDVKIQMTGGDLLTRLYRLGAEKSRLSGDQQRETERLVAEANRIIYSLKSRFHQRLLREMKSRLDSLRWFLDDAVEEPSRGRANYPYEVRNRQRIEEIVKQLGGDLSAELSAQLAAVDTRLRAMADGDRFVWDPSQQAIFPVKPYWYLYAGA
jgi:hypothetical protein